MYAAVDDPYLYRGTSVLKNIPGIRDAQALERFEAISTATRAEEPFPAGRYSVSHFVAIHRHLFQDVYVWAGKPRTIRISKGGNPFCYPENIGSELRRLFQWLRAERHFRGLDQELFVRRLAHFLAELNAIHPFREGNGRTQLSFAILVAAQAGHPLNLGALDPGDWLRAMIKSFGGDEGLLAAQIRTLVQ